MNRVLVLQNNERRTWSLDMLLALLFVVSLVSPFLGSAGHGLRTSWVLYFAWFLSMRYDHPQLRKRVVQEFRSRRFELAMLACWTMVVVFNALLGRGYTGIVHLRAIITLDMLVVMEITYTAMSPRSHRTIATAVLLLLGLEVTRSLPTLLSQPFLSRSIMQVGASDIYASASLAGVGEYGFYTALAIALPVFLAIAIDSHGLKRLATLISCAVFAVAIALASFMGASFLLVMGFGLVGSLVLLFGREKLRRILVLIMIGLIGLTLWASVLSKTEQGQYIFAKVVRQASSLSESGLLAGDLTARVPLWQSSWYTLLEYPLFGVGPSTGAFNPNLGFVVGAHSSWLDLPAEYGLVGFGFFVAYLLAAMRRGFVTMLRQKDIVSIGRVVACALFLLGGTYNPVAGTGQISVFVQFLALGGASLALLPSRSSARPDSAGSVAMLLKRRKEYGWPSRQL